MSESYVPCPHCGGEIRPNASFCRHCGSSDEDGWREEGYDGDEDFDYEQYVDEHHSSSNLSHRLPLIWRAVVVVLVVAFAASVLVPLL